MQRAPFLSLFITQTAAALLAGVSRQETLVAFAISIIGIFISKSHVTRWFAWAY